ncbi:GGDEF domain-containing protein [Nocardioides sp.]|uniref:GGDEF domain-containing protein n=1 Tax=Nocardioides sp. TaxID=35761 RepID=UPI001A1AE996|nr:GGDEF domain-containing protein [Nocardioides sp.]MBJ7359754.1 GGDEF domain-containing protein [Nocardioides sp.]
MDTSMMPVLRWMQPRNHRAAARTVPALGAVAIAVSLVFLPMAETKGDVDKPLIAVATIACLLAAVLCGLAWRFDEANTLAWAVVPLLCVAAIVVLDLATHDAGVTAQIFFVFPVLYGASLLPREGAIVMTTASVLGEAIVVGTQLPADEALMDTAYLTAALVTATVLLVRSAEHQEALVAKLRWHAATDSLTGLVTRRTFDKALESALERRDGDGTSLLVLDVDWFKTVNDRFGHPGGDEVLVQLSALLVEASRRGDVVCRLGGDEMAVLMPECTLDVARRRAEEIVLAVREHGFAVSVGTVIKVSVSVGIAHAPTHAEDAQRLYSAADEALYAAKRGGRDRMRSYGMPSGVA